MAKLEHWQLKQRQAEPLEIKEQMTAARIKAYYEKLNGEVYVSFSGGKDSTVLLLRLGAFIHTHQLFLLIPALNTLKSAIL